MIKLVRRTTGEVVFDVSRKTYPNRRGYSFGGSVTYVGKTADGQQVEIPSTERRKYVEGFSVGDEWWTGLGYTSFIEALEQLTKNTVRVSYRNHFEDGKESKLYNDEVEGRVVEQPTG